MSDKRKDYISWDEYFMGVAKLASMRSKDPEIAVGRIARALKGGGHEMAAGCSIFAKTQAEAAEVLLRYVRKEMNHEI